MSTLTVNTINAATSGQAVAIDVQNPRSFRNLIINGAMLVAQRGTTSGASSYQTVDRFALDAASEDETPTQSQVDVASGTTPYTLGFRKAFKITNGNQTNGAGTSDEISFDYRFEAQDIANSGWNYTSASSYITLSFWVKSSVAQDFKFYLKTEDGTEKSYPMATGSLSADTWTKITKTIPGHADLQFDNNTEKGLSIEFFPFIGTDKTASVTDNAWMTYSGSTRVNDNTTTWYTTNDATLEFTGFQLEVGDVATDFEHRSYGDELLRCKRYFNMFADGSLGTARMISDGFWWSNNEFDFMYTFPVEMRLAPTIWQVMDTAYVQVQGGGVSPTLDNDWTLQYKTKKGTSMYCGKTGGGTAGNSAHLTVNNAAFRLGFQAEL